MRFLIPGLLILLIQVANAEPVEFRAEYIAEYRGLPVEARGIRELVRLDDRRYRLVSAADSLFTQITETSDFEWGESGIRPVRYEYIRKGLGKNKHELSEFDWREREVSHDGSTSELEPGVLDKLSYQYKLRLDVAEAMNQGDPTLPLVYEIADEEKRKLYRFRIAGTEFLPTPVGELETVRVERMRADTDRRTTLWLSLDYDFLLVRLKQVEANKGFELNLRAATVAGNPL
jgi:hypothetical protein